MNQNHGIYIAAKGLNVLNLPTSPLSWIWKVKAPPKMLFFLWLCSYNSIPVREVLGSKGLSLDQSCPICRSHPESRDHLLKECSFSVSFWNQLGPPSSPYSSFGLPFQDWIHANCTSGLDSRHHHIPWSFLFLFGIWFLWINRNCVTHQAKQANPSLSKECIAKA